MKVSKFDNLKIYHFKNFRLETLEIESQVLKNNPLGDSPVRNNPILIPNGIEPKQGFPVVIMLSGLTGSGPKSFAIKTFEANTPQSIDRAIDKGQAPKAIYVFVDAMTFWGGSQFINSQASGRYEDYLMKELIPAVCESYNTATDAARWCVMGASSGGYGSLHLGSQYPEVFGVVAALAPDSDFERALFPDIYKAAPTLLQIGIDGIRDELTLGKLFKRKNGHDLLNSVAMAHCYSDKKVISIKDFPIDLELGITKPDVWRVWREHDPLCFLPKRASQLQKLKQIYLDVGRNDEFHLQFGARRMAQFLRSKQLPVKFTEFSGGHFDMAPRRLMVWTELEKEWKTLH